MEKKGNVQKIKIEKLITKFGLPTECYLDKISKKNSLEMCKCYFLDCKKKGVLMDNVEIAPQQFQQHKVCKKHVGRKLENISRNGRKSYGGIKLKPASFN